MPPALATVLSIAFIVGLVVRDRKLDGNRSAALWLPTFWMAITGSRFLSQWFDLGNWEGSSVTEGNPMDAAFFLGLIVIGAIVVARRRINLATVWRENRWLILFVLYGLLSVMWSEFPFIALKRWVKTLGHPVMAMVILTDPDPVAAFRTVMKRCAYALLTLSVLFIKYLPEYGRGFDSWTGEAINRGVCLSKNDLGYVCMIAGMFFFWNALTAMSLQNASQRRYQLALSLGFLCMVLWLLQMSHSATSLMTFGLGMLTMLALGSSRVLRERFGLFVVVFAGTAAILQYSFDVYGQTLALLGRDANLTDRTIVWADALKLQDNPLFGLGFESFWLGHRLDVLWAKWWWKPIQAHNGYIETYLNLGFVGLLLLTGMIVSTFRKISRRMSTDLEWSRLRMGFLFSILAFNYTEASFKAVHLVWTIFNVISIDVSPAPPARRTAPEPLKSSARERSVASIRRNAPRRS